MYRLRIQLYQQAFPVAITDAGPYGVWVPLLKVATCGSAPIVCACPYNPPILFSGQCIINAYMWEVVLIRPLQPCQPCKTFWTPYLHCLVPVEILVVVKGPAKIAGLPQCPVLVPKPIPRQLLTFFPYFIQ